MGTNEYEGVSRLQRVSDIVDGLKTTYPDAKKLSIDIRFEWQTTNVYSDGAELCPVVKIDIER
jgi:hypothetical protein